VSSTSTVVFDYLALTVLLLSIFTTIGPLLVLILFDVFFPKESVIS
jgi:hypothetical protein